MRTTVIIAGRLRYFHAFMEGLVSKLPWVAEINLMKAQCRYIITVHASKYLFQYVHSHVQIRGMIPDEIILLGDAKNLPDWPEIAREIRLQKLVYPHIVIKNYAGVDLDERNVS